MRMYYYFCLMFIIVCQTLTISCSTQKLQELDEAITETANMSVFDIGQSGVNVYDANTSTLPVSLETSELTTEVKEPAIANISDEDLTKIYMSIWALEGDDSNLWKKAEEEILKSNSFAIEILFDRLDRSSRSKERKIEILKKFGKKTLPRIMYELAYGENISVPLDLLVSMEADAAITAPMLEDLLKQKIKKGRIVNKIIDIFAAIGDPGKEYLVRALDLDLNLDLRFYVIKKLSAKHVITEKDFFILMKEWDYEYKSYDLEEIKVAYTPALLRQIFSHKTQNILVSRILDKMIEGIGLSEVPDMILILPGLDDEDQSSMLSLLLRIESKNKALLPIAQTLLLSKSSNVRQKSAKLIARLNPEKSFIKSEFENFLTNEKYPAYFEHLALADLETVFALIKQNLNNPDSKKMFRVYSLIKCLKSHLEPFFAELLNTLKVDMVRKKDEKVKSYRSKLFSLMTALTEIFKNKDDKSEYVKLLHAMCKKDDEAVYSYYAEALAELRQNDKTSLKCIAKGLNHKKNSVVEATMRHLAKLGKPAIDLYGKKLVKAYSKKLKYKTSAMDTFGKEIAPYLVPYLRKKDADKRRVIYLLKEIDYHDLKITKVIFKLLTTTKDRDVKDTAIKYLAQSDNVSFKYLSKKLRKQSKENRLAIYRIFSKADKKASAYVQPLIKMFFREKDKNKQQLLGAMKNLCFSKESDAKALAKKLRIKNSEAHNQILQVLRSCGTRAEVAAPYVRKQLVKAMKKPEKYKNEIASLKQTLIHTEKPQINSIKWLLRSALAEDLKRVKGRFQDVVAKKMRLVSQAAESELKEIDSIKNTEGDKSDEIFELLSKTLPDIRSYPLQHKNIMLLANKIARSEKVEIIDELRNETVEELQGLLFSEIESQRNSALNVLKKLLTISVGMNSTAVYQIQYHEKDLKKSLGFLKKHSNCNDSKRCDDAECVEKCLRNKQKYSDIIVWTNARLMQTRALNSYLENKITQLMMSITSVYSEGKEEIIIKANDVVLNNLHSNKFVYSSIVDNIAKGILRENIKFRKAVIRTLQKIAIEEESALLALVQMAKLDSDKGVRKAALYAISESKLNNSSVREALLSILDDEDYRHYLYQIGELNQLKQDENKDSEKVKELQNSTRSFDFSLYTAAIRALKNIAPKDTEVQQLFLRRAFDERSERDVNHFSDWSKLCNESSALAIADMIGVLDREDRGLAFRCLEDLKERSLPARGVLLNMLETSSERDRTIIERILAYQKKTLDKTLKRIPDSVASKFEEIATSEPESETEISAAIQIEKSESQEVQNQKSAQQIDVRADLFLNKNSKQIEIKTSKVDDGKIAVKVIYKPVAKTKAVDLDLMIVIPYGGTKKIAHQKEMKFENNVYTFEKSFSLSDEKFNKSKIQAAVFPYNAQDEPLTRELFVIENKASDKVPAKQNIEKSAKKEVK